MADPMRAFVYIVESPSSADLFDGRTEGGVLRETLKLAEVRAEYRLATNVGFFDKAIGEELLGLANASKADSTAYLPMLHISAHGNPDGIELTDGTFLHWDDLRLRLHPINEALNGLLIVGLSSCHGSSGLRMAAWETGPRPFGLLFGHHGEASWSDLALGFAVFYHRFICINSGLAKSLDAMRAASGSDNFQVWWGPGVQQGWTEYWHRRRKEEGLEP